MEVLALILVAAPLVIVAGIVVTWLYRFQMRMLWPEEESTDDRADDGSQADER